MADLAIIGAGWAGLAAAVEAVQRGHRVTLFEMAPQAGGRARSQAADSWRLDNGQHILIGAYTETLALMRRVGADPERLLTRLPLTLVDANGAGLRLPPGPALPAFARGVWAQRRWRPAERLALLLRAGRWLVQGFRCAPGATVAELSAGLPAVICAELIEPLCVAALNTPADAASGQVFLRVLRDALFGGPGAADLLLPRAPLAELLPEPALAWLAAHGATLRLRQRVMQLEPEPATGAAAQRWRVDGTHHDAVILACSAHEAARLSATIAPDWSARAAAFGYEPIITVTLRCCGARLAAAMVQLAESEQAPAQFAFDQGLIRAAVTSVQHGRTAADQPCTTSAHDGTDLFTFVISGAAPWLARGAEAATAAVLQQARTALRPAAGGNLAPIELLRTVTEKRATFRCTPGLPRPAARIGAGLLAAGDYIDGPYPATLEGAVRAGLGAVRLLDPR